MLNIIDLERRWFRYKLKFYLPYLIVFLLMLALFSSLVVLFNGKKVSDTIVVDNLPKKKTVQKTKPLYKKEIHKAQISDSQKLKLQPSLNFIHNMKNSVKYNKRTEKETVEKVSVRVQKRKIPQTLYSEEVIIQTPIEKTHKISITRKETKNDISNVIKRFKNSNNPALSLFVANKYYELGNYTQAYNYALITNQINQKIEKSWILFSKSLVKLGKKKKAIEVLKKYTLSSQSNNAKLLLKEIESGKFR